MRDNWIMPPLETAVFIGAATLAVGGLVMIGIG